MPRIALRITADHVGAIQELTGGGEQNFFVENDYVLVEILSNTELNMKILTEDEMLAEFSADHNLLVVQ